MIKDIATKEGAVIDLPDNFYSQIADMHSESKKEAVLDKTSKYAERVQGLPATKKLYYEQPEDFEFEAVVIDFFEGYAVLDQTLFYPEGGGRRQIPAALWVRRAWHALTMWLKSGMLSSTISAAVPPARRAGQGDGRRGTALLPNAPPHGHPYPPSCLKRGARRPYPPVRCTERGRGLAYRYQAFQAYHPEELARSRSRQTGW